VIGINDYEEVSPLLYARNDAEALVTALKDHFGFAEGCITLLLDNEATQENILSSYLGYANADLDEDSRLVVYFAGHGHTVPSRRGEVGFLVPSDGDPNVLSSLIRWDQITRSADLIGSKHILFLMDACYGGLAITRSLPPGTSRFLKDMMLRVSRQVITAGKADELVSDEGGPIPDHSIFTGHLLQALGGLAADSEGVMTANMVMSYVYRSVGRDPISHQTPHFGYLDGDGDFIFTAPILSELQESEKEDQDILFAVPFPSINGEGEQAMSIRDKTKELLSDPSDRIGLHDLVVGKTREAISMIEENATLPPGSLTGDEFAVRLDELEGISSDLVTISALMGYWGSEAQQDVLTLPGRRLAERVVQPSGSSLSNAIKWYPMFLMAYSLGVAAVASANFVNLHAFFSVHVPNIRRGGESPLIVELVAGIGALSDSFKKLPGHEKQYVPHSEYVFKRLQPKLDDLLFLGGDYERFFDRFEMLFSLEHAHQHSKLGHNLWGPIGRFGWKHTRGYNSPFDNLVKEANAAGEDWEPIVAGFFDGSYPRFEEVVAALAERLAKLPWF